MTGLIIALVGLSGVGKTTFLKRLGEKIIFQHLSAGTLIATARSLGENKRDTLRSDNIDENQRLLVSGFKIVYDPKSPIVVLDGHAIIHTPSGIDTISPSVFEAIGINGLIHLSAAPEDIYRNRIGDKSRARPPIDSIEIANQQHLSLEAAKAVTDTLKVPFLDISATEYQVAIDFMESIPSSV